MKPSENRNEGVSGNGGGIWRDSSYEFWRNDGASEKGDGGSEFHFQQQKAAEDPTSKLIGEFLHKQKASGGFSLDMDLEMQELKQGGNAEDVISVSPVSESPLKARSSPSDETRARVSFKQQQVPKSGEEEVQVLRCTSNASFRSNSSCMRRSTIQTNKNRSRLLDPPEQKPVKSSPARSGLLSGKLPDEDEDDPFLDEDLPQEYKKGKIDFLTLIESVSLVVFIAALVCSCTMPYFKDKRPWKLELWKWEVLVLVLICGRLVSNWVIRIVVFFIERNFLLRKRVLYFVYGLRKAVRNCMWLGLVLVAWHFLFDKKVERATGTGKLQYVTKVLVCLLVGTLVWLVKTLIVKVLASSFHVSTYFDRIQESLFNQYVIETLSGPPLVEMRKSEEEEEKVLIEVENFQKAGASIPNCLKQAVLKPGTSGRLIGSGRTQRSPKAGKEKGDEGITVDHLHRLSPKNVSAWNMKRLMNLVRFGKLSTLDEKISSHNDESAKQISSEDEAKAAAKKIFQNVAKEGSNVRYIYMEDLMRFMSEDEASRTMSLFEGATENHRISKSSLKNWVVNAFRERRALALTLDDTKTAVKNLHRMVNTVVAIIIFIIWLLVLGITTGKFLLLISSQVLLVVFIFGNSCKTTFEAIIFLFVMHPFDVGDRCEIDGVQMIVEEMNILTTVFLKYDNQKIIFPNSALATKCINNYRRSPDMGDAVEFCVHIATPPEKIAAIKQRILRLALNDTYFIQFCEYKQCSCMVVCSYIENKSEHWYSAPMIIFKDVEDLNKLRIAVWLTHSMNHQDMGERWRRRSLLVEEMVKIFKDLDIQYRLLPLNVNVRALPSTTSGGHPPLWPGAPARETAA
ncbi:hypothetical protein SAY86_018762 [Trapa natans]|uniref:Mechanosensitive ion channel protein n=1 Tax=Trapa natans TaxID=22666 RepID=A0AAN7LHH7_TRANT|nr:hypothetical protein SAY86_018762 [Trapa natans]